MEIPVLKKHIPTQEKQLKKKIILNFKVPQMKAQFRIDAAERLIRETDSIYKSYE